MKYGLEGQHRVISVNIIETELTPLGEMAELVMDKSVEPCIGMILMDENSETWEVTGTLRNKDNGDEDRAAGHWTFQCKPVSANGPLHPGKFTLIH